MSCWIGTISYARSTGYLRTLYDRVKGPNDNVDNVMKAHSLRPHTMEGHCGLYKSVLHHTGNTLPGWLLETFGIYTSLTNECDYSVAHHFAGLSRLLGDQERADACLEPSPPGGQRTRSRVRNSPFFVMCASSRSPRMNWWRPT